MFQLEKVPQRLTVLGSGAIACEMAQAFSRLGSSVDLVFRGSGLMWREDDESMKILEDQFSKEGIRLHRNCTPTRFSKTATGILIDTNTGNTIETDRVLCALGRRFDFESLQLDRASVTYTNKGITIDKYLRTTNKQIYACGDCNGQHQFSHAAMHQGMLALMNCMIPSPFKYRYDKYAVPWTVFTEPQISRVGLTGKQLNKPHRTITVKYEDYGAAIAESVDVGHVKAHVSPLLGKIIGVTIVGEGSGEMINEWALAMQNRLGMYHLMMQQHSFPTMGFLTKRVAETWMMENMESGWLKWLCRKMFGF
jgi:pyruvate/2-oxoglutarate dehydrogenase complex dihydrolipoamide dehydrogenase (E3) component